MTSIGFFDQAIAAPSMKAALEAWGSKSNLFHQGFAKETDDPAIVEATMAKPGLVLKRPIGSNQPFKETAELPTDISDHARTRPAKSRAKKERPRKTISEQAKREGERRKQEAAEAKARERREHAVAKAQAAFEKAEREHARKAGAIDEERAAIEERAQAEDARWQAEKRKLETALRRARGLD
jgi:colicin import membrane protein